MAEKIQIRLNVGRSVIPLTIPMDKEQVYRDAAKAIQDKLNRYRTKYPDMKEEQCMNIVLLDFATRALSAEQATDTEPYENLMSSLTKELEQVLSE